MRKAAYVAERLPIDDQVHISVRGDLRGREHDLWNPVYRQYANNLYLEATKLTESAGNAVEYARVLGEYRNRRNDVGAATKVPNRPSIAG